MVSALLHAPPTKAAAPAAKVPTALVPVKNSHAAETGVPAVKSKFQTLLDLATHAKVADAPGAKTKTLKNEISLEKPKETKKADHKEASAPETGLLAAAQVLPNTHVLKLDVTKIKTEVDVLGAEKAKPKVAKPGEGGQTLAWNAASAEGRQSAQVGNKTERSEDRPKIVVIDRRTDKEKDKEKLKLPGAEAAASQPVNAGVEAKGAAKTELKTPGTEVQVAFQTVAGKGSEGFDLKPQNAPVPPRDAASFQQYLVDKGYGQLVDQARIVLKDQNAGEIRMTLYPETLGKVKVELNLSDSSLAGQIFVENQTVKDVFQSNMDGLMQAFRDGGWNDLSLQVSVGGQGGQGSGAQNTPQGPQAEVYGRQVTQTVSDSRADQIGSWNGQVNLTA